MEDCRERRPSDEGKPILPIEVLGGEKRMQKIITSLIEEVPCEGCTSKLSQLQFSRIKLFREMKRLSSQLDQKLRRVAETRSVHERSHRLWAREYFTFYNMEAAAKVRDSEDRDDNSIRRLISNIEVLLKTAVEYQECVEEEKCANLDFSLCLSNKLYPYLLTAP